MRYNSDILLGLLIFTASTEATYLIRPLVYGETIDMQFTIKTRG